MPLSREEVEQIAKSSAQTVLEGLHRYTVAYKEPDSIEQGLQDSMIEERTAADWYRKRAEHAAIAPIDSKTFNLYRHIAEEEDRHYDELNARLQEVGNQDNPVTPEVQEVGILDITRQQFEAAKISGYKFDVNQKAIASRRGGITTVNSKFFELNPAERESLLLHELGHDVAGEMLKGKEWQSLLEPFRKDKPKPISVHSTYDNPFGLNERPEELLADAYAWYSKRGVAGWEGAEHLNILRAVGDTANKLKIEVKPTIPKAALGMPE